ncbi:MAG: hypothetical protein EU532_07250 [Promethearchaeota archaeon]|nr:MAG: hypothetical protein EU532_07250 [Candidatus Lokiarchaeota archaeon]
MHFLTELVEKPVLTDPAKNNMNIHRHFYRYSKGDFIGPALKISTTKSKITFKGSHEYEDLIQEIVTKTIDKNEFEINGNLITGSDINEELQSLGLSWNLKKSTGKTINYNAEITSKITPEILLKTIEHLRKSSYLLISFNISPNCKVTTKKRIPQPSKKKVEDDDINKRIQFCSGTINNTEKNLKMVISSALKDFASDLPDQFKEIVILNNYKIDEIILPKEVNNSLLLRIMAIRKGKLFRSLEIDGNLIEKQYNIVV